MNFYIHLQKMMKCFFVFFVWISIAYAETSIQIENGVLMGAKGVVVDGKSFDVSFQDGTCANLFAGCTSSLNFEFKDIQSATDASDTLINNVFLKASQIFSYGQIVTNGCAMISFAECHIVTPYEIQLGGPFVSSRLLYAVAEKYSQCFDGRCGLSYVQNGELSYVDQSIIGQATPLTYAVWSSSVAAVPELPIGIMLIFGILTIASIRRFNLSN